MSEHFKVAVQYGSEAGWLEYDEEKQKAEIHLGDREACAKADEFFCTKLEMQVPHETLMDFTKITVEPLCDLESFKLALSRLWEATGIHVDWSRPVDYVMKHPTLDTTVKGGDKEYRASFKG